MPIVIKADGVSVQEELVVEITRKIEFDAGHRIPDHKSKCRNAHGHRYTLECTVEGPIMSTQGASDHGMVVDFGDLKAVMMAKVGEPWDHAFLVARTDHQMIEALRALGHTHKTVLLENVPTVENLVVVARRLIESALIDSKLTLKRVRLYETPNCWADA
jgi:6-pyruvoyltetrahydropterin/6-carboxytetrahydropterin synthase